MTISRFFNSVFRTRTSGRSNGNSIIGGIVRYFSKKMLFDFSLPQLQLCSKTTTSGGISGNSQRARNYESDRKHNFSDGRWIWYRTRLGRGLPQARKQSNRRRTSESQLG